MLPFGLVSMTLQKEGSTIEWQMVSSGRMDVAWLLTVDNDVKLESTRKTRNVGLDKFLKIINFWGKELGMVLW